MQSLCYANDKQGNRLLSKRLYGRVVLLEEITLARSVAWAFGGDRRVCHRVGRVEHFLSVFVFAWLLSSLLTSFSWSLPDNRGNCLPYQGRLHSYYRAVQAARPFPERPVGMILGGRLLPGGLALLLFASQLWSGTAVVDGTEFSFSLSCTLLSDFLL